MEIHKLEKYWLVLALVLIIGFIATVTYGAIGVGIQMVNDEGGTVDPNNLDNTEFADPGIEKVGENEYDVHVISQQFLFVPGSTEPIRVPTNSRINFYITSSDVLHGFEVVDTNINTMAIPGQVAKLTVVFEEPGEYGIVCTEYCGSGHHFMEGQLEAVPKSEFSINSSEGDA